MKMVAPKPLTYLGGSKAVLLLHGFTGNTGDVRKLGKYLQKRGYTCHAPLYSGHGAGPDKLILTGPNDWWKDAEAGYNFLKAEGYQEIAVAGVSLGGVFALKIAEELQVKGVISMSAPAKEKNVEDLYLRVLDYAKGYKRLEGKSDEQIDAELWDFEQIPMPSLKELKQFIMDISKKLDLISAPIFVLQGCLDNPLYLESAKIIYNRVNTEDKQIKWYEHSDHIITLGKEREKVYEDIYTFLNTLNWG